MNKITILFLVAVACSTLAFWIVLHVRNLHLWFFAYVRESIIRRRGSSPRELDVYFCFADHFEPFGYGASPDAARKLINEWVEKYPLLAARHRDSDGRHPVHSFFYPAEEYDPGALDQLKTICDAGLGDVEVHLHHDNDTAENLERTLVTFKTALHERHGFLRRDPATGEVVFCFIHGNWALDNSRPDGRWCGVDNELDVLVRTGCRCDMTMPSAPSDTQTSKINSIYFAHGHAGHRKSHDSGRNVSRGSWGTVSELLLIQGPLCLNWQNRKFGFVPRIESAEISYDSPPTAQRVELWERCAVGIQGAEGHIFIKVHTHGAVEKTLDMLLTNGGLDTLWNALEARFRDRPGCRLHYVTAWEMYEKVRELAAAPSSNSTS